MYQTVASGQSINRRAFLTSACAGAAIFALKPIILWANDKPIKIGGQFSLTGAMAPYGVWGHRAVAAAVNKINDEGGINGRKVIYIAEDSQTNVQVGIRKMRKLIQYDKVDFILGDAHSGINIACVPIAKEENTIYFGFGTAAASTEDRGNRYFFRGITNMRIQMKALVVGGLKYLGKRWYIIAADYAWGHSVAEEIARSVEEEGGRIIGKKYIPLGTKDFIPYLKGLEPSRIDAMVIGLYGRDALTIITQIYHLFGGQVKITGNASIIEGFKLKVLGPAGDNLWYVTQYPRLSKCIHRELKSFDRKYRQRLGVDTNGFDPYGRIATLSFCYAPWEHVHYIKRGIELSGWNSRRDNPDFIQALEGMHVKGSLDFPQGDKVIRAQDHQVFHGQYLERVEGGKILMKEYIDKEKLYYEPRVDYTRNAF
jgi:branched-chain amino acid transport system substrate-binding protein